MRILLTAATMVAGIWLLASPASAAPAAGAPIATAADHANVVIDVAGGCGRWRHRGPRGGCRR
jgi:hypothetical protein